MRFQYRAAGPIAAASILVLLAACSRTQQDWRVAQQAGTPQAYQAFVARHPGSELAGVARQRISQLTEQAAWRQAKRANTAAAYQDYLAKYPHGVWSQDARIRMESGSLAGQEAEGTGEGNAPPKPLPDEAGARAGQSAPAPGTVSGTAPRPLPAPAAAAPSGVASAGLPPSPGHGGRFAVQLGAFSSAARARIARGQLSSRFRAELRGRTVRVVPVSISGRRLYRLEASVPDRAAARRLCRKLQRHSQGCLPVP